MRRTERPNRYGRRAPRNVDRNLALPAVPAASTKGSTGRQHVAAARTLPTADSAAASPPREGGLPIVLIVWLFIRPSFPLLRSCDPLRSCSATPPETPRLLRSGRMAK